MPKEEPGAMMISKQREGGRLPDIHKARDDSVETQSEAAKKRDRILGDGVLIDLMKKSDYEGFKRLGANLVIFAFTAYCIKSLQVMQVLPTQRFFSSKATMLLFMPLYLFFGFQFQCFAFAGQHEFLHRSAFKTRWLNDLCLFVTGVVCFELGEHERGMEALGDSLIVCSSTLTIGFCVFVTRLKSCTNSITRIRITSNWIQN
jgi:hypothetical protein